MSRGQIEIFEDYAFVNNVPAILVVGGTFTISNATEGWTTEPIPAGSRKEVVVEAIKEAVAKARGESGSWRDRPPLL